MGVLAKEKFEKTQNGNAARKSRKENTKSKEKSGRAPEAGFSCCCTCKGVAGGKHHV
jgi:hypothetical protein